MKNNIKKKAITKEEIARAFILFAKAVGEYLDELEEKISQDEYKENEHPRNKNGQYKKKGSSEETSKDIQAKIDKLNNIDWNNDNTLDGLNKETLEEYGLEDKPISLKKNIINKNKNNHEDITEEDAKIILANSLYKPELVIKANKDKLAYHNFITRIGKDKNTIVLLELSDEKEKYEIVNFHYIRDNSRLLKELLHERIMEKERNKKS